jgi:hypothetical protein
VRATASGDDAAVSVNQEDQGWMRPEIATLTSFARNDNLKRSRHGFRSQ